MKYTFLLPAFKGRFLDEMLRSIQGQTYRDFKVIISDDCSPEDLRSICEPYLSDPRFTYRRNAENMGSKSLVSHWNLLVDICDTEFLILASDDDVYEPQFLEEIDKLTVKYSQVDLFRARIRIVDQNRKELQTDIEFNEFENHRQFLESHFRQGNFKCIANHVFRTRKLKDIGGFYETPLAWYSDHITSILASEDGCAYTKDILFNFRLSDINITGRAKTKYISSQKSRAILQADEWFSEYLTKKNIKDLKYNRWGKQIYYFLMEADFKTFLLSCPKIVRLGLWDKGWMTAIARHQLKNIYLSISKGFIKNA